MKMGKFAMGMLTLFAVLAFVATPASALHKLPNVDVGAVQGDVPTILDDKAAVDIDGGIPDESGISHVEDPAPSAHSGDAMDPSNSHFGEP